MSKVKNIPEKYISKIMKSNPYASVITTEYINDSTELKIYCKKHSLNYCHTLKNAMRSNGCPECKREKMIMWNNAFTTDDFIQKVSLKNPNIEVLGEYTKQGCHILCRCTIHDIEFYPNSSSLLYGGGGCPLCAAEKRGNNKISSDIIKKNFHELNPTLQIIDEEVKLNTFINVHCDVCNNNFLKKLTSKYIYTKKCKCSVCINRIIVKGFNDVATVRPDLVKYFNNKDDAYKYGQGMTKTLTFICPDCGYEKNMKIEVLARQGFGCPCCGDGISYPNKFIRNFIRQLENVENIEFEYSPEWAGKYFYDCYFEYENNKYVIEVDGRQHFKKSLNFKMTLDEVIKRDKEKDNLAKENGCILIRIDAQKSNKDYLSNSIKNSILSKLFNLETICWEKCDAAATSNLAKEICHYAEETMPDKYSDICQVFDIGEDTIRKYLKQGLEYGWCTDRVVEKLTVPKKVNVYNMNGDFMYTFNGIKKCSEEMSIISGKKYNINGISDNCHELIPYYKDYIFKFAYKDTLVSIKDGVI